MLVVGVGLSEQNMPQSLPPWVQVTLLEPRGQILLCRPRDQWPVDKATRKLGLRFILDDRMTTIKSPGDRVQVTLEKEVPRI